MAVADRTPHAHPAGKRAPEHNQRVFQLALCRAERRIEQGRLQSATEWCRVASSFAMTNPMPALRSRRLETLIDQIAAAALQPAPAGRRRDGRRRVLHVITEASAIGGHSRLVERWIQHDSESESTIAITRQPSVLPRLAAAARASGGAAEGLGIDADDSIARAARLRQLAADSDLVICHLHSDDVVAALAFGAGYAAAPVALYNHADHLFWLAPTQANLVIDAREVAAVLTREARGYLDTMMHSITPLVPGPELRPERAEARRALGAAASEVVAVSVARAVKYADTPVSPRFSELARTALLRDSSLSLCLVGPTPQDEPWPELLSEFGGRIRPVGSAPDPMPYLCAADIYLDSFPFSSITSLLEAEAAGLATLTLDGHRGYARALGVRYAVADDADRPCDGPAFLDRLHALVTDPGYRAERAAAARKAYQDKASVAAWAADRERLYQNLRTAAAQDVRLGTAPVPPATQPLIDYALTVLAIEGQVPLTTVIAGSLPRFDAKDARSLSVRRWLARITSKLLRLVGLPDWPTDSILVGLPRGKSAP